MSQPLVSILDDDEVALAEKPDSNSQSDDGHRMKESIALMSIVVPAPVRTAGAVCEGNGKAHQSPR